MAQLMFKYVRPVSINDSLVSNGCGPARARLFASSAGAGLSSASGGLSERHAIEPRIDAYSSLCLPEALEADLFPPALVVFTADAHGRNIFETAAYSSGARMVRSEGQAERGGLSS